MSGQKILRHDMQTGETIEIDTRSLDDAKAEARARVTPEIMVRIDGSIVFLGKPVQLGMDSVGKLGTDNIAAKVIDAMLAKQGLYPWPVNGLPWRCGDNSFLFLSADQMIALGKAAGDYVTAVRAYAWTVLLPAIAACQTREQADAIDTASGWPSNVMG